MKTCRCQCITSSDEKDFESKIAMYLGEGYKIVTARYECFISNFIWYAILVKEDCE